MKEERLQKAFGEFCEIDWGDWYEEYIEPEIRDLVRLLRDNGFNTECSCGHEMYVQCSYIIDGELMRLHNLLFSNGYRNYEITVTIRVVDSCLFKTLNIELKKELSKDCIFHN